MTVNRKQKRDSRQRCRSLKTIVVVLSLFSAPVLADSLEVRLKTAFVVNIAKFINWREETKTLRLCMDSESPLRPAFESLKKISIGRDRIMLLAPLDQPQKCHMVFAGSAVGIERLEQLAAAAPEQPVIISDLRGALEKGADIQLYARDLKLRIAISNAATESASYQINSKLLHLANMQQ